MLLQPTCACVVYFPICIVANNNNDMKIHLEFILALGRFLINSMFFFLYCEVLLDFDPTDCDVVRPLSPVSTLRHTEKVHVTINTMKRLYFDKGFKIFLNARNHIALGIFCSVGVGDC